jgi:hypothetical protein
MAMSNPPRRSHVTMRGNGSRWSSERDVDQGVKADDRIKAADLDVEGGEVAAHEGCLWNERSRPPYLDLGDVETRDLEARVDEPAVRWHPGTAADVEDPCPRR